jgi:hypothetical protein
MDNSTAALIAGGVGFVGAVTGGLLIDYRGEEGVNRVEPK